MKIIYIAHPIAGDVFYNKIRLKKLLRELNMNNPDIVPFAPYLVDLLCLDDDVPEERERGIKNSITLFRAGFIDEVWLYGNGISSGMAQEIKLARELNIPVVSKTHGTANYESFLK